MLSNQSKRPDRGHCNQNAFEALWRIRKGLHRWLFGILLAICSSVGSSAANVRDDPVIALHCSTIFAKGSLCDLGNPLTEQIPCSDFDVQQPVLDACNVFLMVARADASFGVQLPTN
jgi:hypothetical protein